MREVLMKPRDLSVQTIEKKKCISAHADIHSAT